MTSIGAYLSLRGVGDRAAGGYVLMAVVGYSLMPLVIDWAGGGDAPFLFNACWRIGFTMACLVFLVSRYWTWLRDARFWRLAWSQLRAGTLFLGLPVPIILLAMASHMDSTLFTLSLGLVDTAIAAVLFETWPILMVVIIALLFKRDRRYAGNMGTVAPLMALALAGFTLVIFSQDRVEGGFAGIDASFWGVLFALGAACVSALGAYTFRWGADFGEQLSDRDADAALVDLELLGVVLGQTAANLATIPLNGTFGWVAGEGLSWQSMSIAVLGGMFANRLANIYWRRAVLITSNLGVNALAYVTPLLSLIWLALFWHIDVERLDFLVIGATAIVSANLLINFEAERLLGFKALVMALWIFGAVVYFRDMNGWQWVAEYAGYFEALALSATVFTLLLSFRVARLANRTRDEDNWTLSLVRDLDMLAERGVVRAEICECVLAMDSGHSGDLERAYGEAMDYLEEGVSSAGADDRVRLAAVAAQLDMLAHSRQQGINFGELCALFIFAGITVGLALMSRPVTQGLTGFLIEVFVMLFATVVVFLAVNVIDLQRDRNARVLERIGNRRYRLVFVASGRRRFEQGLSVVIGVAMVIAYCCLLGSKWLGWFG